jgi:predicted aconitase
MQLSEQERLILDGRQGEAARLAMAILVDLGEVFGAPDLMPVAQVHIDATLYMVDAGVEFAEHFASLGARFAVPTSLNPAAVDLIRWRELRVPPDLLENSRRLERAYLAMGAVPTWTCAPYQQGMVPRFGEQIAWGESNAIAFANSVIGARTNRYGDLMDICAAIIGKVPRFGLHLTENRRAQILIRLVGVTGEMFTDPAVYPLIGYRVGEIAGDRVAAVDGLPAGVPLDALKRFFAAAASAGAVGLCHLVGITPEAPTIAACFKDTAPQECFEITRAAIADVQKRLQPASVDRVDLVTVGCPHYSFAEFEALARRVAGRHVAEGVVFWAFTNRTVYAWIETGGLLKTLTDAGVSVFTDGCPLQHPKASWSFAAAVTDSAKFAHYCRSQTGFDAAWADLDTCVDAALTGVFHRRRSLWH